MSEMFAVPNLELAILELLAPAITRFNRLEGRPRTHDFDRALKAEVRDALWMLARQWQLGEFKADDAGSPVLARVCVDVSKIDRFQTGVEGFAPLRPDDVLEAMVEQRPLPLRVGSQYLALDVRLAVGRRWLKLLAAAASKPDGLADDYAAAYRVRYAVRPPDPGDATAAAVCAHADAWQLAAAAGGRAMDGIAFLEYLAEAGRHAYDGIGAQAADEPTLEALASRLIQWFRALIAQPGPDQDAWNPERLEYEFHASAHEAGADLLMHAREYHHGRLDWYGLDAAELHARAPKDLKGDGVEGREVRTFIPAPVAFPGMPNTRWWAFEDQRTNFGAVRPDTTDLGKILLLEFAFSYANDWFVLPYTIPVGTTTAVKGIALSNVFGERFWIEPVTPPSADWRAWTMFTLSRPEGEKATLAPRLVLLPSAVTVQEAAPLESVTLIRDELANMVWGIERRIALPSGASRPGAEAAREYRQFLQRLIGDVPEVGPAPAPPIRYQVMNTVPEQWIPFIPVHVPGSTRETQLQRAALPRILAGNPNPPAKVRPRTTLLRARFPDAYFIHEEQVPRAGRVIELSYQRARRADGSVVIWLGTGKQTGRGEGSSGLRFDALVNTEPPAR